MMNDTEKTELALILICIILLFLFGSVLPETINLARLTIYCSGLLLFQGLIRDLWYLYANKHTSNTTAEAKQCICLESSIGTLGILMGTILLFNQFNTQLQLTNFRWAMLIGTVLVIGFLMKDLVFYWQIFRIHREKNHSNIIFTLKNKD